MSNLRRAEDGIVSPAMERIFRDPRDRLWCVREIDATVPGRARERCLILESTEAGVVRRVWHYPTNWRELPIDRVIELLES